MITREELHGKYDEMGRLWSEIEAKLVSLELPHPVWVDCDYNPTDHTGLKLGFDRFGKSWRICLRDGDKDPVPIDQCPVRDRIRSANHVEELMLEARMAHRMIALHIDEAIAHIEKFLASSEQV